MRSKPLPLPPLPPSPPVTPTPSLQTRSTFSSLSSKPLPPKPPSRNSFTHSKSFDTLNTLGERETVLIPSHFTSTNTPSSSSNAPYPKPLPSPSYRTISREEKAKKRSKWHSIASIGRNFLPDLKRDRKPVYLPHWDPDLKVADAKNEATSQVSSHRPYLIIRFQKKRKRTMASLPAIKTRMAFVTFGLKITTKTLLLLCLKTLKLHL